MEAPRESLVRGRPPGDEIRNDADGGMPTLVGHFTPFDEWSQIDSWVEGNFMERTVKGAFAKTIRENRDQVKVTFNHGHDVHGDLVLGPIDILREERAGPYYEVPLFDTTYNRDLLPGLKAGVYGSSYRFRVIKDEWDDDPGRSDNNPDGIAERTIREVRLYEFGPVTYPAFDGATAAVRSMTDGYMEHRILHDPVALERLLQTHATQLSTALTDGEPHTGKPADATPPHMTKRDRLVRAAQVKGMLK